MNTNIFFTPSPGLQAFGPNLWIVEGTMVRDTGMWFTTRMAIVKLTDGSLWIESPVPVSFNTINQITQLGEVKYLVAATPRHVWRLDAWHSLFPEAQMWVTRKTPFTLAKGDLNFTGTLQEKPIKEWKDDLDLVLFKGSPSLEEGFFLHEKSRTLIMDDMIQVHTQVAGRPVWNTFLRMAGVSAPLGGVSIDIRMSFSNRKTARESLAKILAWDFDKIIIAHGPCVIKDAKAFVKQAFHWLTP